MSRRPRTVDDELAALVEIDDRATWERMTYLCEVYGPAPAPNT